MVKPAPTRITSNQKVSFIGTLGEQDICRAVQVTESCLISAKRVWRLLKNSAIEQDLDGDPLVFKRTRNTVKASPGSDSVFAYHFAVSYMILQTTDGRFVFRIACSGKRR